MPHRSVKPREPLKVEDLRAFETVDRYAAYLDISPALLRREIKRGRVPVLYFGRIMRVPTDAALSRLLKEAGNEPGRQSVSADTHSVLPAKEA